jgi:AraC-like DNA-binding protein
MEAGTCTLTVDGATYDLNRGDYALIQPRELVTFEAPVATTTPYIHFDAFYNARRHESFPMPSGRTDLHPYGHLVQPRLNDVSGVRIPTRFRPTDESRFRRVFLDAVALSQQADTLDLLEAQGRVTELIALLFRDFRSPARETRPPVALHWITSYLSLHLADPITVGDLAARTNLSASRFAAVFRQQFGVGPHAYLTRLRVEHARSLLATTDSPLAEIAVRCGFSDAPHLSKSFRRATLQTPGSYRRSIRMRTAPDASPLR